MKKLLWLLVVLIAAGCKKNVSQGAGNNQYYLGAIIDGKPWEVFGQAGFSADYFYDKSRFRITIGAGDQDTATIPTSIEINFDFVPKPGTYYFNNTGSVELDSGTIAIYTYHYINIDRYKWSTGGYVKIDSFTKDVIKGTFSFTAQGDITDTTTSYINNGQFYVGYSGGSGAVWTGP